MTLLFYLGYFFITFLILFLIWYSYEELKKFYRDLFFEESDDSQEQKNEYLKLEEKKLNEYIHDLKKSPLKLEISREGFPLCPVCGDEFKDDGAVIDHLRKNKNEFNDLTEDFILENNGEKDRWVLNLTRHFLSGGEPFFQQTISEEKNLIKNRLIRIRLYDKIKDMQYKEWRGEIKKKGVRESPISQRLRFDILKRDNYTCQYCGRKSPDVQLEVDHIEPYSKTKNNHPDNLITSCKECNRGKRTQEVI